MTDFSTAIHLTIPEGEVTRIRDSSGGVVWEAIHEEHYIAIGETVVIRHLQEDFPYGGDPSNLTVNAGDNPQVVNVVESEPIGNFEVTGLRPGTTIVTIRYKYDGEEYDDMGDAVWVSKWRTLQFKITVTNSARYETDLELNAGDSHQFIVNHPADTPSGDITYYYMAGNEDVVEVTSCVNEWIEIFAVGSGTATICFDFVSYDPDSGEDIFVEDIYNITVHGPSEDDVANPELNETIVMSVGKTVERYGKLANAPDGASIDSGTATVTVISNNGVVSYDTDGADRIMIDGLKPGTAKLRVEYGSSTGVNESGDMITGDWSGDYVLTIHVTDLTVTLSSSGVVNSNTPDATFTLYDRYGSEIYRTGPQSGNNLDLSPYITKSGYYYVEVTEAWLNGGWVEWPLRSDLVYVKKT
jgi:hypothetical protein